jgi:hypothetical protein
VNEPTTPPIAAGDTQDAFARALDGLLAAMSPEQARVVRLSAVPHWLDAELLADLLGDPAEAQHALDLLRPLRLVNWEPDGRFRVHDAARPDLRRQLRSTDLAAWQAANTAAWAYFRRRLAAGTGEQPVTEQVEALYHQLVVDEPGGLAELGRAFDEAVWNHQLGLAERFVRMAGEQADLLAPPGRAWVTYYQARLAQLLRTGDGGAAAFSALAQDATDPRLAAAAHLGLARADVAGQRWQPAVVRLRAARAVLRHGGVSGPEAARVALALGDVYRDLALRSGGFGLAAAEPGGWWHTLRLIPFLAVRGMARRWRRAPNWWWWHAGMDYQDWIIAWLLQRAQGWYRQAATGFGAGDLRGRMDAATALAETSRQLGRWAVARSQLERLLTEDVVVHSPYATARAELGLGTVLADAGELVAARGHLTAAGAVFQRFGDSAGVAAAGLALAQVAERSGAVDEAVAGYADCVSALTAAGDPLARTEVDARLATLAASGRLAAASRQTVAELRAGLGERHYLARFSGSLLVLFRRLAVYVVLPLAFVVGTVLLGIALQIVAAVVETEWQLLGRGLAGRVSLGDHVTLVAVAVGLALAALWVYPFLHGLAGMLLVHFLGRRLVRIEREQPARVVLTPDGIGLYDGTAGNDRLLSWSAVQGVEAADLCLWQRALHLVSRTAVTGAAAGPLVVEGIVARYEVLQAELQRLLPAPKLPRRHELRLLAPRWVAGVLAAAVALVAVANALGVVPVLEATATRPSGGAPLDLTLTLTMPVVYLFVTFVLLLTTVTHWRLVAHTRRVRRATGLQLSVIAPPLLALAAVLWTAVCAVWLWYLLLTPAG